MKNKNLPFASMLCTSSRSRACPGPMHPGIAKGEAQSWSGGVGFHGDNSSMGYIDYTPKVGHT